VPPPADDHPGAAGIDCGVATGLGAAALPAGAVEAGGAAKAFTAGAPDVPAPLVAPTVPGAVAGLYHWFPPTPAGGYAGGVLAALAAAPEAWPDVPMPGATAALGVHVGPAVAPALALPRFPSDNGELNCIRWATVAVAHNSTTAAAARSVPHRMIARCTTPPPAWAGCTGRKDHRRKIRPAD